MNNKSQGIRVGILGLGTVACGVIEVLRRNKLEISRRAGQPIFVNGVCAKDKHKIRSVNLDNIRYYDSAQALIHSPQIDIVVELIGGCTDAKEYILSALACHKPIVTANKALLAEYGNEIFEKAQVQDGIVGFEATVAGGIPIIKTIREGLGGNRIQAIAGIINATSNYIFTKMRDEGCDFKGALAQAKAKGYAEADPTLDISGQDAAHKLAILAANAFGIPLKYKAVFCEGIQEIDLIDMVYAKELGYELKHLALAKAMKNGLELRVHPTLIPRNHMLAHVDGVMNAVLIQANALGSTLYYGAGAGSEATASAIVADLLDVARMIGAPASQRVPYLAFYNSVERVLDTICPIEEVVSAYYIRLQVEDKPGVLAKITGIFAEHNISIESFMQKQLNTIEYVPIIIVIQPTMTRDFLKAQKQIEALESVKGKMVSIRLDNLQFKGCN